VPGGPADGSVVPSPTQIESSAVPYDFRRPTKLSREHARVLQGAFETFASRLTTVLTSGLRQVCRAEAGEISQQSYDEYINGLPNPTIIVPVELAPLPGTATLQLTVPVAMTAIDHLLGGPGDGQPVRPLTDIEAILFRGLLDQFMSMLRLSLEPIAPVQPQCGAIEYTPHFLQAASATDAMIVADFELVVGRESCRMTLSIPLASLLPALEALRPPVTPVRRPAPDGTRMLSALRGAAVEVAVRFRPVSLDSARLLALAPGDLLVLDHPVEAPLSVETGGRRVVSAVAGRSGTRLAALVVGDRPSAHFTTEAS
jgi:flagellar motor switch protein FliM